jgi:hypothetical protein
MSELTASSNIEAAIEASSGGGASIKQLVYANEPAIDLTWVDAYRDARTLGGVYEGMGPWAQRISLADAMSLGATASAFVTMGSRPTARVTLRKPSIPAAAYATIRRILAVHAEPVFGRAQSLDPKHALDAIRFVLRFIRDDLSAPSVVPLDDGGVQLEWHRNDIDLEVTFTSEDDSGVYSRDLRSGSRWALPLDIAALERLEAVFERLGETSQPR